MVSLLPWNTSMARVRCSAAASRRSCSARSATIALLSLVGRDHLGLDATFELLAIRFRDRGVGADDAEGDAQDVQGGLGLTGVHQFMGGVEPLFDVVGQLLAGEVLRGLGLLQGRLGIGGQSWPRADRPRAWPEGVAGSCMATRTTESPADLAARAPVPRPCCSGRAARLSGRTFGPSASRPGERLAAQVGQLLREGRILGTEG